MLSSVRVLGAMALGIVLGSSCAANAQTPDAQTAHHRVKHPVGSSRQIIVHPRDAYLSGGVGASLGSHHAYVYDTLKPPWRDTVQGTFVGMRGLDRLPTPYSVPGSDEPLFHVSLPLPGSNEPFISF